MNFQDVKIVFFDIDGTLLAFGCKEPSEKTREALLGLQKRGIKICIATGRSPFAVPKFAGIHFDIIISYNGSYCFEGDTVLYKHAMLKQDVHRIIANATKIGRPVILANLEKISANGMDQDLIDYYSFGGITLEVDPDFAKVAEGEVYQIMSGGRKEEYAALMEGVEDAEITAWWDRAMDIIPKGGSKAVGIRMTLERLGLTREQSLAFGDGYNDVPMLKEVGLGVAMGNAKDDVKAIAGAVCGRVEEDGIYYFCKEHGLI